MSKKTNKAILTFILGTSFLEIFMDVNYLIFVCFFLIEIYAKLEDISDKYE